MGDTYTVTITAGSDRFHVSRLATAARAAAVVAECFELPAAAAIAAALTTTGSTI